MSMKDSPLVGTWRLMSFESRTSSGKVQPQLGGAAKGQLIYTADGHMSAQLGDPARPHFALNDWERGTETEVRAAFTGYIAYYGRYSIGPYPDLVTHHVDGALFPNWTGGVQVRDFQVQGDKLTITTPPICIAGEDIVTILVWERES
jgi:hypothetical protein